MIFSTLFIIHIGGMSMKQEKTNTTYLKALQEKTIPKAILALGTAFLASLCCIGAPLGALIGISFLSSLSFLEKFRIPLILISFFLIGYSWYKLLKKEKACEDASCKIPTKKEKIFLGAATLGVFFFLFSPYFSFLHSKTHKGGVKVEKEVVIQVEGMTCTGCEKNVENALKQIDGVVDADADYQKKEVYVELSKEVPKEVLFEAIEKAGYAPKGVLR